VKLTEDGMDAWSTSQSYGVQCEGYPTCDNAIEVCGAWNVNQVFDQHLTRPKEEPKEDEEVAEYKSTSSQKVHMSVSYQEQCYCDVQQS
jgi:hypothetical protein